MSLDIQLRSLLENLSEDAKTQLAATWSLEGSIDQWITTLVRPERVNAWIKGVGENTRSALRRWLQSGRDFSAVIMSSDPRQRAEIISEVASSGIVFQLLDVYRRPLLVIAPDYFFPLFQALFPLPDDVAAPARTRRKEQKAEPWSYFFYDLFQVLSFARMTPLPLTQQGTIYRRIQAKLIERLWPAGDPGLKEARLAECINFSRRYALLEAQSDPFQLVVTSSGYAFWDLSMTELWDLWLHAVWQVLPGWQVGQALLAAAGQLPADGWLDWQKTLKWLQRKGVIQIHANYVVGQMRQRFLALGLWEEDGPYARLTDYGYAVIHRQFAPLVEGQMIVEPSGEIMVPPETAFSDRWALGGLADHVQSDRVAVYRVTKDSVARAIAQGWTIDEYLDELAACAKNPLPQNLVTNIQDWFRSLSRHQVLTATILHSENAAVSREAEHVLRDLVVRRLSDTDLILSDETVDKVFKAMERAGMALRRDIERPSQAPPSLPDWPAGPGTSMPVAMVALPEPDGASSPQPRVIREIVDAAIRDHRTLVVDYYPSGSTRPSSIQVTPVYHDNRWLQALDLVAGRYIMLELDNILDAAPL